MMVDVVEVGYIMDEIKDKINEISLDEQVHMVHPLFQHPNASKTISENILSLSTILTP